MDNRKTRILVVDDEEIVRESMAGWLEKDGYTVEMAIPWKGMAGM